MNRLAISTASVFLISALVSVLGVNVQLGNEFPQGVVVGTTTTCGPSNIGTLSLIDDELYVCASGGFWKPACSCAAGGSNATNELLEVTGSGRDGDISITSSTIVNTYAFMSQNTPASSQSITVDTTSGFSSGDEVLIIQMQKGSSSGTPGRYEFRTIDSTSSSTLTFTAPLAYAYYSGTGDAVDAVVTQVIRVPHYLSMSIGSGGTVTAPAWDGFTGGIVVFRVSQTLTFSSTGRISVDAKGFRGGSYGADDNAPGFTGEGFNGLGNAASGTTPNAPSPSNGGGGAGGAPLSIAGCGGAGGSHAGSGEQGYDGFGNVIANSGGTYGQPDLGVVFMGAGGGGGGDNDQGCSNSHGTGGAGGGIVLVYANTIVDAVVTAVGQQGAHGREPDGYGTACSGTCGSAVGGAGAGGSVWLSAPSLSISSVVAFGGDSHVSAPHEGSNCATDMPAGGFGGNGRVRLDYSTISGRSSVQPAPLYENQV